MADPEFILLGDAVWVDFVNTARGRQRDPPDTLGDAAAYHRWSKAEKLTSDADDVPWGDVLAFRDRLLAVAAALADNRQPPSSAIHEVNRILARSGGHRQLTRVGGTWHLGFTPERTPTALEAIAASAAQSLASPEMHVRQCRAGACTLYFVDRSPGQGRTWCSADAEVHGEPIDRRRALR